MNAQDKAITARNAKAKAKATPKAKAATPRKAAPKTVAAKAAPKRVNTRNVGQKCSVKGCSHDAVRAGMCSSKNRDGSKAAGHYRKALRAERGA